MLHRLLSIVLMLAPGTSPVAPVELDGAEQEQAIDLRVFWSVGDLGCDREAYLSAIKMRLPSVRFVDAEFVDSVAVTVEQAEPHTLRLVIAPLDAEPLIRRLLVDDPTAAERTLSLLTVYALEHGRFPPLAAGMSDEPAEPAPASPPSEPFEPRPAAPVEDSSPVPPPRRWRPLLHGRAGAWIGGTTTLDDDPVVAGPMLAFDAGARYAQILWVGGQVRYWVSPSGLVQVHAGELQAFFGVSRSVGARRRLSPGVRLGGGSTLLVARSRPYGAVRPQATAELGLGLDWRADGDVSLGLWLSAQGGSRASSFVRDQSATGIGRWRGGVSLSLGWEPP